MTGLERPGQHLAPPVLAAMKARGWGILETTRHCHDQLSSLRKLLECDAIKASINCILG